MPLGPGARLGGMPEWLWLLAMLRLTLLPPGLLLHPILLSLGYFWSCSKFTMPMWVPGCLVVCGCL